MDAAAARVIWAKALESDARDDDYWYSWALAMMFYGRSKPTLIKHCKDEPGAQMAYEDYKDEV